MAVSYVVPSAPRTRHIPPVPDSTVPRTTMPDEGDSFVPHGIPPFSGRLARLLFANELVDQLLHRREGHGSDRRTSGLLGCTVSQIVGLEMPFDPLGSHPAPSEKQEVAAVGA